MWPVLGLALEAQVSVTCCSVMATVTPAAVDSDLYSMWVRQWCSTPCVCGYGRGDLHRVSVGTAVVIYTVCLLGLAAHL